MMRTIKASEITEAVKRLAIDAAYYINDEMTEAFTRCMETEKSPIGKAIFEELLENADLAKSEMIPYCQDTGFAVVFLEIGQDVHIVDGLVTEAVEEGVRQAYREGYLRMSICDPFTRKNTGDNTPAIVHISLVEGEGVKIIFDAKGGGSENMSRVTMLAPSAGIEGVKKFVVQRCLEAGSNPCPPVVIGVGIGGTFEVAALLAKKALMLPLDYQNPDPQLAQLEKDLLEEINKTGHGPEGLGGTNYALAVKVLKHPCHIASLPVAVNIDCHAHRHKEILL